MRYRVTHESRYEYSQTVSLCHNLAHLTPRSAGWQKCLSSAMRIDPQPSLRQARADYHGNLETYFAIQQSHRTLTVHVESEVDLDPPEGPDEEIAATCEQIRERLGASLEPDDLAAREFVLASPQVQPGDEVANYAAAIFSPDRPVLDAVAELTARIHEDYTYDPGFTTVATPLQTVIEHRRGVCQDFAHLAIACLRSRGLAARYVSGYLETLPPPGEPKQLGSDASHAWFAVYVPDFGWVDFDPTNNTRIRHQHVTAAWGRDYGDVTPLKGVLYGGGEHELRVAVDVERL